MSKVQTTDEKSSNWQLDIDNLDEQLQDAVAKGEANKVRQILEHDGSSGIDLKHLEDALLSSVRNNHNSIASIIIERSISRISSDILDKAFENAVIINNPTIISSLYKTRSISSEIIMEALSNMAINGNLEALDTLLRATIKDPQVKWNSSLLSAINKNRIQPFIMIMDLILQGGHLDKIHGVGYNQNNPWHKAFRFAVINNLTDVIRDILSRAKNKVKVFIESNLDLAIAYNNIRVIQILLDSQEQNEQRNYNSALEAAVRTNNFAAAKLIFAREENISINGYVSSSNLLNNASNPELILLFLTSKYAETFDEDHSESYGQPLASSLGIDARWIVGFLCRGHQVPDSMVQLYVGIKSTADFTSIINKIARSIVADQANGLDQIKELLKKSLPSLQDEQAINAVVDKISYMVKYMKELKNALTETNSMPEDVISSVILLMIDECESTAVNTAPNSGVSNLGITSRSQSIVKY